MIIDICDAVERLLSENEILIKNFSFKNLYIAKEIAPRILIVITEAEPMDKEVPEITVWKPVGEHLERCYKECKAEPSLDAARYISFIGTKDFSVKSLNRSAMGQQAFHGPNKMESGHIY